jgi:hypothetical protein
MRHASARTTLDTYGHMWPDAGESTRAAIGIVIAERMDSMESAADPLDMTTTAPQVRSVRWFIRRSRARTTSCDFDRLSWLGSPTSALVRGLAELTWLGSQKISCGPNF